MDPSPDLVPRGYNSYEHEICPGHNFEMPTIVGNLKFMIRTNVFFCKKIASCVCILPVIIKSVEHEKVYNLRNLVVRLSTKPF